MIIVTYEPAPEHSAYPVPHNAAVEVLDRVRDMKGMKILHSKEDAFVPRIFNSVEEAQACADRLNKMWADDWNQFLNND